MENLIQELFGIGIMALIFKGIIWFIIVCIFGWIMKHFIREAIKEALDDCGLSKRKTDETW